jgi:hypothetical protein
MDMKILGMEQAVLQLFGLDEFPEQKAIQVET